MLVSIIGANGLLSRYISSFCNINKIEINIFGRQEPIDSYFSNFFKIDLLNESLDFIKLLKSDVIIYAAGAGIQSNKDQKLDEIIFLNSSLPISIIKELENLKFNGVFITFGSYFEIGVNDNNILFNEQMLISSTNNVINDYTSSKRALTTFLSKIESSFTSYHFILPTIYGEIESKHRLIPYTINALRNKEDLNFTAGNQVRQYIYVGEIPHIIFQSINCNLESGIYNISGKETLTVKQLVEIIHLKMRLPMSDEIFGKANRADTGMINLQLDGSLLRNKISFEPQINIIDVIDKY
jgi:hypothetical protein